MCQAVVIESRLFRGTLTTPPDNLDICPDGSSKLASGIGERRYQRPLTRRGQLRRSHRYRTEQRVVPHHVSELGR